MVALESRSDASSTTHVQRNETGPQKNTIQFSQAILLEKHTLHIKDLMGKFDSQRLIYPNGLLSEVEESESSDAKLLKRIELFAKNKRSNEIFGVIRSFFVGFSRERKLLELADFSNNVISVRGVASGRLRRQDKIIEDKLVLKRIEDVKPIDEDPFSALRVFRRHKVPSLIVSSRWLDKMDLSDGDRIIVSNPVENYVTPPPEVAKSKS